MRFSVPLQTGIIIAIFIYVLPMVTIETNLTSKNSGVKLRTMRSGPLQKEVSISNSKSRLKVKMKNGRHLRPTAFASLRRLKNQINLAREQIKLQIPFIQKFYSSVKSALKRGRYVFEWLPKEYFFWYETKIKHLDKRRRLKILIPNLYKTLRNFSFTFEEMKHFGSAQYIAQFSVYVTRRKILDGITDQLAQVLSEVESAIYIVRLQQEIKGLQQNSSQIVTVNGKNWNRNPDHTVIMIQDWGVITLYYKFLKDWLQILSKNFILEYRKPRAKMRRQFKILDSVT